MSTSKTTGESQARDMFVSSTFKYLDSRTIDNKARVSLGKELTKRLESAGPVESFNVFMDDHGHVLLVPMQHIPASEMWIWKDPKIQKSFKKASNDVIEGRTTDVEDLDDFIDSL